MAVGKGNVGDPESLALGAAVGSEEGLDVIGAAVGMAVGAGLRAERAIARLRILAEAASCQGSDAYTCTEGQVSCWGVLKAFDSEGIVTAPDTLRSMTKLTLSRVMVTVDHLLSGKALDVSQPLLELATTWDSSSPKLSQLALEPQN